MTSKFHAFALRQLALRALLGLTALAVVPVWAEKADRDRPMNIEADRLEHDDLRKISVFQGRVIASKGTILLRGQTLEVREDPDGYQQGILLPAPASAPFIAKSARAYKSFLRPRPSASNTMVAATA